MFLLILIAFPQRNQLASTEDLTSAAAQQDKGLSFGEDLL